MYLTYDVDFVPSDRRRGRRHQARSSPIWLDVANGKVYPVFDVLKGTASTDTVRE